jgi:hypothetical protein
MMDSSSTNQSPFIKDIQKMMLVKNICFWVGLPLVLASLTGCSLFVMAGKMVLGDPVLKCDFRQATTVNLVDEKKTILVICNTPDSIRTEYPSLHFDLVDGISQKLKKQKIKVVSAGDVASWLDDNGGYWNDVSEIAEAFETDYIIHLDLSHFDYREENSQTLLRGRLSANINAYEVKETDGSKRAVQIFASDYASEYPSFTAVSINRKSEKIFKKEYIDHVCTQISQVFYDHRSIDKLF